MIHFPITSSGSQIAQKGEQFIQILRFSLEQPQAKEKAMLCTEIIEIDNKKRVKLFTDDNSVLPYPIRLIKGCLWSDELKCWHIPYYDNYKEYLSRKLGHKSIITNNNDIDSPKHEIYLQQRSPVPQRFIEQLTIKRYSENTKTTYISVLRKFLEYYPDKKPEEITDEEIRVYLFIMPDVPVNKRGNVRHRRIKRRGR
jgi:hypothetical protein